MTDRAVLFGGPSDGLELEIPNHTSAINVPSPSTPPTVIEEGATYPTSTLGHLTYVLELYLGHPHRDDRGRLVFKISK